MTDNRNDLQVLHDKAGCCKPTPDADPEPAICPECVQGKHSNCDGTAWDDAADELTSCVCREAGH